MNIFRGLSQQEAVAVVVFGTAIAVAVTIGLLAIVSSLPIAEDTRWWILYGLGVASWLIGYPLLSTRRPKNQAIPPATSSPTGHCHDVLNGSSEKNRKFCHIPIMPRMAIAIRRRPTRKQAKTTSGFVMVLSSFHSYLRRGLHNVL